MGGDDDEDDVVDDKEVAVVMDVGETMAAIVEATYCCCV
jgi:hypothetical protein